MCTTLAQIEATLNNRSLIKANSDDVLRIPLTVDFLQGNLRYSLLQEEDIDQTDLDYNPERNQFEKQAVEAFCFSEEITRKFWHLENRVLSINERESKNSSKAA